MSSSSKPPSATGPVREPRTLFAVPIGATGSDHPGGTIVCTEPEAAVYVLTFTSPPDNRFTTAFCAAMLEALDLIQFGGYKPGVVITTSGIPKFYSNGLDLRHAVSTPGYWAGSLYKLFLRFLTYPMPTIALINGHAFAGGLMLAMHHDYRVMNPKRGFACLNELEFGAPLKPAMSGIFRVKLRDPAAYRSLVLEAHRFPGPEARDAGLVDALGETVGDVMEALVRPRRLVEKGQTGVYGLLKAEMYRECIGYLTPEGHEKGELWENWLKGEEEERKRAGQRAGQQWKAKGKL
ncbi:hypothetical protein VTK73DRAFT_8596 [Phialemonium thermophilum]|uniref:Enoyl-CoA hydratase/carnithine racemase n=1 Tax=Phialemonium thermophilum TaxID=223376 RepID=A0ABR3XNH8_9PEZI